VYYANGDLRYRIDPIGDTTEYGQRDELGNRAWVKNANGVMTRYYYDERSRIETVVANSGAADSTILRLERTADGDISGVTLPNGNALAYHYDEHDWLVSIVNEAGDSAAFSYDSMSNQTRVELGSTADVTLRFREEYRYNSHSLLEGIYDADSNYTEFEYDNVGNRISRRDGNGNYIYYVYNALNRMQQVIRMLDGDSLITSFSYDIRDNLVKVTDPDGYEYVYRYDDNGRLLRDSSAVTGVTSYGYDANGNLVLRVDALGDTTEYQYDALDRLTAVIFCIGSAGIGQLPIIS
jgi:YD repeat-containing protein